MLLNVFQITIDINTKEKKEYHFDRNQRGTDTKFNILRSVQGRL